MAVLLVESTLRDTHTLRVQNIELLLRPYYGPNECYICSVNTFQKIFTHGKVSDAKATFIAFFLSRGPASSD